MKNRNKFYVTTPIYYPNDIPHIGHAYTTIAADVLSRWNKIKGKDVFFLTGTDDHGKKIAEVAKSKGKSPKEFTNELIPKFKDAWRKLNLKYDKFIRTTDPKHMKVVSEVLQKVYDNGDIYKGNYEGLYCVGCEAYYTEKDLLDGNICLIHKKEVETIKEESYFFKLSKYQKKLLDLYEKNSDFISPNKRKQEVINRVKEGLRDLSISRVNFDWGIPLPFDKKHVCYVWFDALFNYYSATREKDKKDFWPANIHLIGKDILWFHTVYWPAFLISARIDLPKKIFAHGWWTFDKEKISKSRGRVIDIDELISIAGEDSARYFLLRATPFGDDGNFSKKALIDRHNNELADKLGNLVSRVSSLVEKFGIEETKSKFLSNFNQKKVENHLNNLEFDKALNEIFAFIDVCNEYIQNKKPWETKDKRVLFEVVESIRKITPYLWIFMPSTADKIKEQFSSEKIKKGEVLFNKIKWKE
ncbi:MAG: methionine--tRNA ligase [Candidatus Pacearchaeota archaeon]